MKGDPRACSNCNGFWMWGRGGPHTCRLRDEIFKANVDCWHPQGTALVYEENEVVRPEVENRAKR